MQKACLHLGAPALLAAVAAACGPSGAAPVLQPVDDQVVAVNQELVIVLAASDKDGDDLFYSFESDVPDIYGVAEISRLPIGAGEFRWTPQAKDVGVWFFDFSVSDGSHSDTETIRIDVRSAVGSNSAPRFLRPQGTGTTLDIDDKKCLEVAIEIVDSDSTEVVIAQERPLIEGAELTQTSGLEAVWEWCPTAEQVDADDRYTLTLSADDQDNPRTELPYLVVLRRATKPDCPGEPPVIAHTAMDQTAVIGLTVAAQVTDDQGLKREPLLYYSTTQPAAVPDLAQMTQVTMQLASGDAQDGTWEATVPNPAVTLPANSSANLWYVISAIDDDDSEGDCDHLTQVPGSGSFVMNVTNPGGPGNADLCELCTADIQCGDGEDDLCVRVGNAGQGYCLRACSGGDCPPGYSCSSVPVESVENAMGRQCVPNTDSCTELVLCEDDSFEDNDTREEAQQNPLLSQGDLDLVSCPASGGVGDDEDWFEFFLAAESTVDLGLAGGSESDLDLALYDESGALLASSTSFTSIESISECLPAGFYTIRVLAFSPQENEYTLSYSAQAGSCAQVCEADENEEDDDAAAARTVSPLPFSSTTQSICSGDDDWFEIFLFTGEQLVVDLTFEQLANDDDLDIHLYDSTPSDLTPCSATQVDTCDTANGQSGTSNEHFEWDITTTGTYYVVVRGFDGSENLYDIAIDVN